ncbi:uncharacterized protein LOC127854109 [Dreissena polymorpha]|uniref:uncharacterized protein LOC127854109 n=1 Tax=Dreissena polymorpha TaxID=45954 RepID=UPI00226535C2|nr:uncharacterized protein LOC127854109 [Dreissena polymorpha]
MCEMCQYVSFKATFYCEQCSQRLCNSCVKLHNNMKLLAGHNILKVDETKLEYDYARTEEELGLAMHAKWSVDLQSGRGVHTYDQLNHKEESKAKVGYENIEAPSKEKRIVDSVFDTDDSGGAVEHVYDSMDFSQLESLPERFSVTVEPGELAQRCGIEGVMTMVVTNRSISFEDPTTLQKKYVFQLTWFRRFGKKHPDHLFLDVGTPCPNGKGVVSCIAPSALEIHKIISSKCKKR